MSVDRAESLLGRYHLGVPLGGGPTGEVFRAKLVGVAGFEREFALKRFHKAMVEEASARESLGLAARQYSALQHPRIARMHEFGTTDGVTYAAVELVAGVDLARLLAAMPGGPPFPPGGALYVITQLARTLGYAHGRGIMHSGICPTNVLCTPEGDIKLVDFGFLRARLPMRPAEDLTLAARLPYLAPEQLVGAPPSNATDVFQLATLAYELLTGERAFGGGDRGEIAARILAGSPPDAPIAASLREVLRRAVSPKIEDRYSDAQVFAGALDATAHRVPMPGGRTDVATAAKRAMERADDLLLRQVSGALTLPMPAPPPAVPASLEKTMMGVAAPKTPLARITPPPPPPRKTPPSVPVEGLFDGPPTKREPDTPMSISIPELAGSRLPTVRDTEDRDTVPSGAPSTLPPPAKTPPMPYVAVKPPAAPAVAPAVVPIRAVVDQAPDLKPAPPPPDPPRPAPLPPIQPAKSRTVLWIFVTLLVCAALGAGGYVAYERYWKKSEAAETPSAPDAAPVAVAPAAPAPAPAPAPVAAPDAAPVAAAAPAPPPDAAPVATATTTTTPSDNFTIESMPRGAGVYLDGALKGKTPLDLPATGDRHKLAIILPGYRMYRGEIEGTGRTTATLQKASPPHGPAGIKVKCKSKNRFYVTVDGVETGEICPTERINVDLGVHKVEVYDPISDAVTTHEVHVEDTHFSVRVKLEE